MGLEIVYDLIICELDPSAAQKIIGSVQCRKPNSRSVARFGCGTVCKHCNKMIGRRGLRAGGWIRKVIYDKLRGVNSIGRNRKDKNCRGLIVCRRIGFVFR